MYVGIIVHNVGIIVCLSSLRIHECLFLGIKQACPQLHSSTAHQLRLFQSCVVVFFSTNVNIERENNSLLSKIKLSEEILPGLKIVPTKMQINI